jgi:hypothetical protein
VPVVAAAAFAAVCVVTGANVTAARPSGPTKGMCAGAWNQGAPKSVLAWARRRHVWQATVQESIAVSSGLSWKTGQTPATTRRDQFPTCLILLFAPRGGATVVTGAWQRGTVPAWASHAVRPGTSGSGNACVAGDGTIHRVGPFTASSRCPRAA